MRHVSSVGDDAAERLMAAAPEGASGVVGVLLAGGLARRMGGGDKCLRRLGEGTILEHVIERARPHVAALMLNANGDPARFAGFNLPVMADVIAGFAGPLAGVLTGMEWARKHRTDCPWILTIATDTPFFPTDLVGRMLSAVEREGADLACAASGGRAHPVFGLWPVRLADDLRSAMVDERIRKVDVWTARHRLVEVTFPVDTVDPFFNTNRPEDLAEAERLLRACPLR
jgi:molybdenum cofactor guanylyltransferase